jgi:hypothetical protein
MKIKNLGVLFVFLLCCGLEPSIAQKNNIKFLGIEGGASWFQNEILNKDYLRGDVPSYYSAGTTASYANCKMYINYAGINSEFFLFKNKLGIMAGLNYSRLTSSINKNGYESNSNNFFYFLYRQDGVNTEYLKINEIYQKSDYVGIPIELRYLLFKPHPFRPYFKIGAEFSYRFHTKTEVDFINNAMEIYKQGVIEKYDQPESFSSLMNGAIGLRIGNESTVAVNLEIRMFSVYLSSSPSSLADPMTGGGFRLEIQVPLKSKAK